MNLEKKGWSALYPLLLGACAFFLTVGFAPLNPNNADWILGRLDPTQHYLGWLFFRNGPWTFPVGLNPLFGLDLSSSIVYSDSIPLLAIPLKAIDPLLPDRFHYFGLWIFASFLLQAWLSWKILGLYSENTALKLLGCGLFIFFPPMLWRINTPAGGHSALVGHFLILWALYLILRGSQRHRTLLWSTLLSIAVLTHFYLFSMIALLWVCDLINHRFIRRDINNKNVLQEFSLSMLCILFFAWQAGYFAITASLNNDRGYGFYGMNILGLFDAQGWSYILKSPTNPSSWGEGFAYLGLGAILAGIAALVTLLIPPSQNKDLLKSFLKRHRPLGLLLIFLTIFAISNHIGFGDFNFNYPLPAWALKIFDALRSSARLFWPVHYLLLIAFFVAITKCYPKKVAFLILGACFLIQAADTSKGWISNRNQLSERNYLEKHNHQLSNIFWKNAGKQYKALTLVPSVNRPPNWENFSIYAISHKMKTNAVHMARVDLAKEEESNAKLNQQINSGTFDQDTLYVVENRFVIAALASAPSSTAIAKVDTFNVIAPEWNACQQCPPIDPTLILTKERFEPKLGQVISFANSYPDRSYYFRSGWSWSEDWGTWSDSKHAVLNFAWPSKSPKSLTIQFDTFVLKGKHPIQEIDVKVNGRFYKKLLLTHVYENQMDILLTPEMKAEKFLSVEFEMHNLARPVDLIADRPDHRKLGIGVRTAVFR